MSSFGNKSVRFRLRKVYAVAVIESGEGEFRVMGCRDIEGT
ncbi:hypothetical protein VCR14J2_260063 [Vibrio coralliirubri]|nr:hypothetical protein VCR14J2_260063 [Vibrio coralliirubri]